MPLHKEAKRDSARRRLVFDDVDTDDVVVGQQYRRAAVPAKRSIQQHLNLASSSAMKENKDTAFATPRKKKTKMSAGEKEVEPYVPTYIHKNVSYFRKGVAKLSDATQKTFALVEHNFVIPLDFEQNRKYGPLSGTSFEERAISAYNLGMLPPKHPESDGIEICSVCAIEGHKRDECPTLI